ncbi:MAG: chromosome segregation protein SMC, partial [Dehalococcoidales bacterium]|nr:chromosome segregation protein SMC [Dehalococcoidales bacterium]
MYLKRLEIQGFKSLADKIELQFNPGISAVVGPNGSGKSNIADAVRWVLGEQRVKSLRGAKMEDVIFSGSDRRKQVGMAEVSLTLDNSAAIFPLDYAEITVTRRVYRSGESEFMVNKSPCRLRDIYELFMDTGIGREGYSIIGQGKIDEILSTKSEDRRVIIEEAAGIVKYKTRKQLAVKKLADTEQNMVRLSDIISELETQVGPLGEQAEKAREFLEYKNELVDLDISLLVNQLADQQEKLAEINTKDEALQRILIESETASRHLESTMESQKLSINKLDEEIMGLQKEQYELGSLIEKREAQAVVARERLKDLDTQRNDLLQDISELSAKESREREQHAQDERALVELQVRTKSEEGRLAGLEGKLAAAENSLWSEQQALEESKAEIIDLLNEIAGIKNSVNAGEIERQNLLRRITQLEEQNETINHEKQEARQKQDGLNGRLNRLTDTEVLLTDSRNEMTEKRKAMEKQLEKISGDLFNTRELLQHKTSRLKALQDLQNDYEGYYRGVKEVLTEGQKGTDCPGICGVVAEIIKVPAKYETAVEVALGSALQFIITGSDSDARAAIGFLKKTRAGRATFLPLDTIRPAARDGKSTVFGRYAGFCGLGADLVKYDGKFATAVEYLLGRVAVAENIASAIELAKAANYWMKVVTLEGDVINPGGAITGGVYQRGRASLLGRIREIEETAVEIEALEQKTSALENDMSAARQEHDLYNAKIAEAASDLQELSMDKNSLEKDLEVVLQELERLDGAAQLAGAELRSHSAETAGMEEHREHLGQQLHILEQNDNELRRKIE